MFGVTYLSLSMSQPLNFPERKLMQNNQSVDDDVDYDGAPRLTNFYESIKNQMGNFHYMLKGI